MLARPPTLRALFRTPVPRPAQFTRSFSRVQFRTPTPPLARTSLSITYRALPLHLQNAIPTSVATYRPGAPAPAQEVAAPAPSTTQWTHFATAYSYSSVRTFTSSRTSRLASAAAAAAQPASTSPEAAQRIDEVMETISELYASAQDEFEMAFEETEKNTTYAAEDREAAREELDKLLEYYNEVLEGDDAAVAEEIKRRAGGRIRELEQAVIRMEEDVSHGD